MGWGSFLLFLVFQSFIISECWILSPASHPRPPPPWKWRWFLFFIPPIVVYYISYFLVVKPTFYSCDKSSSWCSILFMCCWIDFANILLKIFASVFLSKLVSKGVCVWCLRSFGIRIIEWIGSVLFPFIFWKNLLGMVLLLFKIFDRIHHYSDVGPSFSLWKTFGKIFKD